MTLRSALLASFCLAITACGPSQPAGEADTDTAVPAAAGPVQAQLIAGDGQVVGQATLREDPTGTTVEVRIADMGAGRRGMHLHDVGSCKMPSFESAGAHLNPAGKQHGRDNPQGSHLGDLANLTVSSEGKTTTSFLIADTKIAQLMDDDGVALVIHAEPDDYRTDPSGNSGDRIACAAFN